VATIQPFKPPLELNELHVSVIVEYLDGHTEMEDMTMRMSQERNVVFVTGAELGVGFGCGVSMDAFFLESDPDHPPGLVLDAFGCVSLLFNHGHLSL
jgi:hypothetical protein